MTPKITTISERKVIGMCLEMSYADYKSGELWQRFMPRSNEVQNRVGTEYFSIQQFSKAYWHNFSPSNSFKKWAAVEVTAIANVPTAMESFIIPQGLYAVFVFKGYASTAASFFASIFNSWLPNSIYDLADRPHFEILGDNYKNDDPNSEEEVWIPIQLK